MRTDEPMRKTRSGERCCDHGGRRKNGEPCHGPVIAGTTRCRMHTGKKASIAKAQGAIVVELRNWGLGDTKVDPGEVMLRLVSQSAARVGMLSSALAEAYDAADRLRSAHERELIAATVEDPDATAAALTARADLDRIFLTGGVAALIGHTYTATQAGGIYATGEAIRGLALLEGQERDRCANFCTKAIAAGLAKRQVEIQEESAKLMGAQMAAVMRAAFAQLQLSPEQLQLVPSVLAMVTAQLELTA